MMSNTIPTIPEDSIRLPQSSKPDPAGRLKELAKKIRSYEEKQVPKRCAEAQL